MNKNEKSMLKKKKIVWITQPKTFNLWISQKKYVIIRKQYKVRKAEHYTEMSIYLGGRTSS